tara:strand:+ start:20761 stop:21561 length:801 start_codon:yes stop_codon:yes gene_type:complete
MIIRNPKGQLLKSNYTTPQQFRQDVRDNLWNTPTTGVMDSYVQANVVILPEIYAQDFVNFCEANSKPCPLLEVLEPGIPWTSKIADRADIRTDVPAYKIYSKGVLSRETNDISSIWRDDLVTFFLGCSFSFEYALQEENIPVKHQDLGTNVPMFITNIQTVPSNLFSGPMVVSMRPIPDNLVDKSVEITSRFPDNHGAPIHIGSPASLGISDLQNPDYGDPVPIANGETPVFWACGVTPQAVALTARPELMITHSPGHMFVTDMKL